MNSKSPFIHLRLHSAYSLAEGAVKIKDIPGLCHKHKMPAVALTDTRNLFGALEFATTCSSDGIQPIVGCQFELSFGEKVTGEFILLAQNEEGYENLLYLNSQSYINSKTPGITEFEKLIEKPQGLIALTGGINGILGQLFRLNNFTKAQQVLEILKQTFDDRLYIEIQRHGNALEEQLEDHFLDYAYRHDIPIVATNNVFFATPELHEAHDALLCISEGRYVSEEDRRRETPHHYFKSPQEMTDLFKDLPEAILNTFQIAQRCSFMPEGRQPIMPAFPTTNGETEKEELFKSAFTGLNWRLENYVYAENHSQKEKESIRKSYEDRLNYELGIIETMGFCGYFLIVADFIQWAKKQDIPVGPGRGSGAGSLVAWVLTITDIDPIRFTLLFERFLNPERVSLPDFDVDFCQERRDEVIQYVLGRYGADRVAHIITFGKLQARAVLRDVGRVLQMAYGQVDKICKLVPNNPANPVTLQEALKLEPLLLQEKQNDPQVAKLIDIGIKLEGLYRHASTHAAGVVIGDRPLYELVPLYKDPTSEIPATQFNMKDVEKAGLVKFDFLGLKTLTVIEETCKLIRQKGIDINIGLIPLDDQKTLDLLCRVETVGIFQVESGGMRDVLRRLKPDRFEDLIVLVALFRPGPMDDIPKYLACKHGEENISYLHPMLQPILEPTYGVMVYQEQVMQIAQTLGGYTLGAADLLRRAMGKKIKKEMDAQRELFVEGAKKNNINNKIANQIFDLMAKFAGYGFNKSHSAPYALLSYQTAYLKAHHPLEFFASSMTQDISNIDKLMVFRQDMGRLGYSLLPPCVNKSYSSFAVEGNAVRYALSAIKNVGEQTINLMVQERDKNGKFQSIQDFANRVDPKSLNKRQLENLIAAGAFDSIHSNRRELWENIDLIIRHTQNKNRQDKNQISLFSSSQLKTDILHLEPIKEWNFMDKLQKEFESLGCYQSAHPLSPFDEILNSKGIVFSENFMNHESGASIQVAGVLISKQERTSKNGHKFAFAQFSDLNGSFEVTLFSEVLSQYRDSLVPGKAFLLRCSLKLEEDSYRLTCQSIQDMESVLDSQDIVIPVRSQHQILEVKNILSACPKGPSKIIFIVETTGLLPVNVELSEKYSVSSHLRAEIKKMSGLIN